MELYIGILNPTVLSNIDSIFTIPRSENHHPFQSPAVVAMFLSKFLERSQSTSESGLSSFSMLLQRTIFNMLRLGYVTTQTKFDKIVLHSTYFLLIWYYVKDPPRIPSKHPPFSFDRISGHLAVHFYQKLSSAKHFSKILQRYYTMI